MRMSFATIFGGGLIVFFAVVAVVVFAPTLVWNPEPTLVAHPYTAEQQRGRVLFYSNGCNYCHTQYVREVDTAMGPVSAAGDYVFDTPVTLGSERTGPDLSYIGRKRSKAWQVDHLKDPRKYSPLSIMPSFAFLPEEDLEAIAEFLFAIGDRAAAQRMIAPPAPYARLGDPRPYPKVAAPAAPSPGTSGGWAPWTDAGLQEGKETYVAFCMDCHGVAGNGLGAYGGTLAVTPADFRQEPFRSMSDDEWFWHVSEGVPGTVMPPWKQSLSVEQRWNVIRYIKQVFAQPVMRDPAEGKPPADYAGRTNPLPLTIAGLEQAKHIFTRDCTPCHGYAGTGGGIFRAGLQPPPPDFGDGSYGTRDKPVFDDADYFWRISEGLPWSAMPAWKSRYSQAERWNLVHYVRSLFTQTEPALPKPGGGGDFEYPDVYKTQTMPASASFERGKQLFLDRCSDCHGLAGDGGGKDGQYLSVLPADFIHNFAGLKPDAAFEAELFAKITFGIKATAMPSWGELLTVEERWDLVKFVTAAFIVGIGEGGGGAPATVPADLATLSLANWTKAGNEISADRGKRVYSDYCAACHGSTGAGNGLGTVGSPSKAPPAFRPDAGLASVFWRVRDGVAGGIMPAFQGRLSPADLWNVTAYVQSLAAAGPGASR
jgi:mono/diheme cytochrome c family protein